MLIEVEVPTLTPEVVTAIREAKPPGRIGRPYGARNKRKRAMEDYLSKFAPEVLETLVARAIAGAAQSFKLAFHRVNSLPAAA